MRIGLTAPPVPGHLNPMCALGARLRLRGHEVVFFSLADAEPAFRALGLPFLPFGAERFPPGDVARRLGLLSRLSGEEAFKFTVEALLDSCRAALEDGPRVVRESRVDALVLDELQQGFPLVAMYLGIPYVHVSNAVHSDFWGYTPLRIYDWPHEEGPAALARNRQGLEMYERATAASTDIQREFAERVGLQLDWHDPARTISRRGWFTQTPREFDFPSNHWPDYFHYVGPLHDGTGRAPVPFPWERLSGEPLIYASMGSLQNGAEDVFRKIVAGAAAPGRQVVLSIGANLSLGQLGALPANTVAVNHAPQIELLKRSALCITHAGLNTALESLAQGVPMVAIPVTNDQPGVAARIAHTKTGVVIPLKELSAERVCDAVSEVMTNPCYRENARRLQAAIRKTNGLDLAADLIERAFEIPNAAVAS